MASFKFELHDSNIDFPSTTFPSTINSEDHNLLEKEVTIDEIKYAVWNCGNDKAPGPDGFTFGFIKRYWEIFKHDIQEFVIKFFESKKMLAGSNSSFITLIPKVKVIKALHSQEGGFDVNVSSSNSVWSKIVGSSNFLNSNAIIPNDYFRFRVGCGSSTRFWKDHFGTDFSLFGHGIWSRSFMEARTLLTICDLITEITPFELSTDRDVCFWNLSSDGLFFVSSARQRFMLDRLSHRLNLSSLGIDIPSIGCPSCTANVESSNHIFFDCDIAKAIWNSVCIWCEVSFPLCSSFDHWKVWFDSWQAFKERKRHLHIILAATLWWLWRFRNNSIFGHRPLKRNIIYDNIRSFSFSWLHHRGRMSCSWTDWLKSPLLVSSNTLN
ncbi:RNA-directed DNA polymerase, eukaryota, reverse transcriptase zinc-binding domain protein [Tanacetum coccineum]